MKADRSSKTSRRFPRTFCRCSYWLGVTCVGLAGLVLVLFLVARAALRPPASAWATHLHLGPVAFAVDVPSLIRLSTTPWLAQAFDGLSVPTRFGPIHVNWDASAGDLRLQCQPCTLRSASWGNAPLRLANLSATVRRRGMQLQGTLASGKVVASWRGQLTPNDLSLEMTLPSTPVRDAYAVLADTIPEVAVAQITGTFALHATLKLPSRQLTLEPQLAGLTVQGLGTEQWTNARSQCGKNLPRTAMAARWNTRSWLARAVIAAEDQRFFEHPGYDAIEMAKALRSNQQAATTDDEMETSAPNTLLRGASTLSQQVAKLLVTGDQRTPARKLRELLYAVEMEQTLGKARILRLYLENAPWGGKLCGAQAAAYHYFGKRADRLTAAQAVWLAAMLHNPTREARRWADTGHINVARAQWVAASLRPLGRKQGIRLQKALADVAWAPPAKALSMLVSR